MSALLQVTDAVASHGGRRVVDQVSFETRAGELRVILGPNGAGKSTLLRVMLALHPLDSGEVQVNGTSVRLHSRSSLAKTVAWVPQHFEAGTGFTVEQVALMGRTPHLGLLGLPSKADVERARAVLNELGILSFAHRSVDTLSGGEQRLVLLARALLQEPKVLLLDEPTAFLDLRHQVELLQKLKQVAASGVAVVAVLHDVNLAAAYADRVLLLKAGRVVADGEATAVLTPELLETVYDLPMRRAEAHGQSLFAPAALHR